MAIYNILKNESLFKGLDITVETLSHKEDYDYDAHYDLWHQIVDQCDWDDNNWDNEEFTKAYFKYHNGLATATCGLGVKSLGQLTISGTRGYIVVEAPWWKTTYFEVHYENSNEVEKYSDRFLGDGLRYEISDFVSNIKGNKKSEFKLTANESIAIAEVMEKFLKENRYNENMGS